MNNISRVLPILLFHQFPADFESHLKYLKDLGYSLVHLNDVADYLTKPTETRFPEKRVVLTFDDGYEDFDHVARSLEAFGFKSKATVCLPTSYVSEDVSSRKSWNGSPTMTWDELNQLNEDGIEIIPHSVSHANLDDIKADSERLQYEIGCSKLALAYHLNLKIENVQFFCLPYGAGWKERGNADQRINDVLREEGYIGALRAEYKTGEPWDEYCIPRCAPSTLAQLQELMEKEFRCK